MDRYGPATQGDSYAEVYDSFYASRLETDAAVSTLVRLAAGGPVLELGVGTGRVALPLAARGIDVHGIDASVEMVAVLRSKPGGADVAVTIGDFAELPVSGRFAVVFAAYNTFLALGSAPAQARCLARVRDVLLPHGCFVVEAFVPDPGAPPGGVEARRVEADRVLLSVWERDPVGRTAWGQNVLLTDGGIRLHPWRVHSPTVEELDAAAARAGLVLRSRWADWSGSPFTEADAVHVSVYGLAED